MRIREPDTRSRAAGLASVRAVQAIGSFCALGRFLWVSVRRVQSRFFDYRCEFSRLPRSAHPSSGSAIVTFKQILCKIVAGARPCTAASSGGFHKPPRAISRHGVRKFKEMTDKRRRVSLCISTKDIYINRRARDCTRVQSTAAGLPRNPTLPGRCDHLSAAQAREGCSGSARFRTGNAQWRCVKCLDRIEPDTDRTGYGSSRVRIEPARSTRPARSSALAQRVVRRGDDWT